MEGEMCQWGEVREIYVIRRNHPGILDGWHAIQVDDCIADYIQQMNDAGIITVGCCCGHSKTPAQALIAVESVPLLRRYGYEWHAYENRIDVVEHWI